MPEGDTIWRTAAALRPRLVGKELVNAHPKRLVGATVTAVDSTGKHLTIRFDNGLALHTHMRMTGAWHLYAPGERWLKPAFQARALLETADSVAVLFNAPVVELVRDGAEPTGHLGPDLLRPESDDLDRIVARARQLPPATAIGEALLDQRIAAGIGNVYRCEALWAEKVDPWRPLEAMSDPEVRALFARAQSALRANLGSWERRFPGHGRAAVHGRAGRPCRRCGTLIQARAQGILARLTFWCPRCQGPAAAPPFREIPSAR